jgi:hypothetical protein
MDETKCNAPTNTARTGPAWITVVPNASRDSPLSLLTLASTRFNETLLAAHAHFTKPG